MLRTGMIGPRAVRACVVLSFAAATIDSIAAADSLGTPAEVVPAVTVAGESGVVEFSADALRKAARIGGPAVRIPLPLDDGRAIELEVARFQTAGPATSFVVGSRDGVDRPLAFDPSQVVLLRGRVAGHEGSHVYLAITPYGSRGTIDLGDTTVGGFALTSTAADGRILPAGQLAVHPAPPTGGFGLPVPMCGLDTSGAVIAPPRVRAPDGSPPPVRGLQQIEMAVETDYEYFSLFGDLNAAGAYVVAAYGAISDIYIRDVNARVDLTFVRLWDTPNDLFNEPDPLQAFQQYWNQNMGHVHRDVAQFFTGRPNLPYGGVAYLPGLCNTSSYSVSGYVVGFFTDPNRPDVFNRDIVVAAHELGHNCNTPHTHDLGLDTCQDENSRPQRGTIMSYCGQTFTGGDANMDVRFHAVCQQIMEDYITTSGCIADDCNGNGIDDALDIQGGTSNDANGNSVPDECEDCNGNGVLDDADIAGGTSADLNANGVPDECEPDCNGNNVPDDLDLLPRRNAIYYDDFETDRGWTVENLGATSGDWDRGVPVNDPNWAYDPVSDSDGSGQCWLTENAPGNTDVDGGATRMTSPRLDMSAGGLTIGYDYFLRLTNTTGGVDRLLVEMNDNDGAGAWATVATHTSDGGLDWRTNVVDAAAIAAAGLAQTDRMRIRFTINDADPQSIVEGGIDALFIGTFIPPLSEDRNFNHVLDICEPDCDGDQVMDYLQIQADMSLDLNRNARLDACEDCDNDQITDLVELDHAHNVWVASIDHTTIREYLSRTGTLTSVSDGAAIAEGQDLIITPDRRVLVSSRLDHRVVEFDVAGTFVRNLVPSGLGGLSLPAGLLMTPGGNLLVASRGTHAVLEYNGATGAFVGAFVAAGSGGLFEPFGLTFGPNGNLFVTSNDNRVLEYNGATGAFVRVFVSAAANGGLTEPRGLLFLPTTGNLLVASMGTNQVLEYVATTGAFIRQFNQNGTIDRITLDEPWSIRIGPEGDVYVSRAHLGESGGGSAPLHLTNARIFHFNVHSGFFKRAYIMGVDSGIQHTTGFDFVPDPGVDCNLNLTPDACDIASGASRDVNGNGVPDECESFGDVNCDGVIDAADGTALALALTDPAAFAAAYPGCDIGRADVNGDGSRDGADIAALVAVLLAP